MCVHVSEIESGCFSFIYFRFQCVWGGTGEKEGVLCRSLFPPKAPLTQNFLADAQRASQPCLCVVACVSFQSAGVARPGRWGLPLEVGAPRLVLCNFSLFVVWDVRPPTAWYVRGGGNVPTTLLSVVCPQTKKCTRAEARSMARQEAPTTCTQHAGRICFRCPGGFSGLNPALDVRLGRMSVGPGAPCTNLPHEVRRAPRLHVLRGPSPHT